MSKGRPRRSLAPSLSPVTAESVIQKEDERIEQEVEEKKQELINETPVDAEHFIDEMNIDKYIDRAVEDNEMIKAEFEVEKNELQDTISKLNAELKRLTDKVSELEKENNELKSKMNGSEYQEMVEKCKKLDSENDELLLKNSELMFNNSKIECTIKELQQKLDQQYHYTPTPKGSAGSPYMYKQKIAPSMNGYQDWV